MRESATTVRRGYKDEREQFREKESWAQGTCVSAFFPIRPGAWRDAMRFRANCRLAGFPKSVRRDADNSRAERQALTLTPFYTILVLLTLFGCVTPVSSLGETTGEKFRMVLAHIDARCRELKMGPYYDPSDPESRRRAAGTDCNILNVKPFDLNAVLATPEGKFAYSIELPPPHNKPRVRLDKTMSVAEYFKQLCEEEAGDFVFRTAEGVDRIRQVRPSPPRGKEAVGSYSEEQPGGMFFAAYNNPANLLVAPRMQRYAFLEVPLTQQPKVQDDSRYRYLLFYRDPNVQQSYPTYGVNFRRLHNPIARYGYVWRGVERPDARELGIIGGDLIVLDLYKSEVMALRRDFVMYAVDDRHLTAPIFSSKGCRPYSDDGFSFLARVLKPERE